MPDRPSSTAAPSMPGEEAARIADVERATGVPRATLRIWERRYGFPSPRRDARGERYYLPEEVERLRLVGQLVARGQRPGTLIPLPTAQLQALLAAPAAERFANEPMVRLLRSHDPAALQNFLLQKLALYGLERFVCDCVAGFNLLVGEAWAAGELKVHEEHFYTEVVKQSVRSAIASLPPSAADTRPRVLLATLPLEQHGLGLLMVEAMMRLEGCPCVSLGTNVPVDQLVDAVPAFRADILALSLSSATRPREAVAQLRELRRRLPGVDIWVGGEGCSFPLDAALGIFELTHIDQVRPALRERRRRGWPPPPTVS